MKVILDADVIADFYKDNRTGIFRVTYELFKSLSKRKDIGLFYSHLSFLNRETGTDELDAFFKDNDIEIRAVNKRFRRKFLPFRKEKLFKKFYKKIGIFNYKNVLIEDDLKTAQIFHSTYYPIDKVVRNFPNLKKVVTVHDLIPILFPGFHFTSDLIKNIVSSIGEDGFVICVSENTKKDLLDFAPNINAKKVFVSLLAASPEKFYVCNDEDKFRNIREKYSLPKKYLLSLATLEPRKNIDHVIRCFIKMITKYKVADLSLVLVGSKGWDYEKIFDEYENASLFKDKVIITGFVPDEDLASLYSHANSFYYMSFYEGFGLPPLEAMQCGVPTVTSNTSSLPEVVADGGIMLKPKDEESLIKTMWGFYSDDGLRREYAEKALDRSKHFSWDKVAEEHSDIYKKIIES
ncbi:glycosyltransferase family 4 protein [Epilithonimonas caeni]|uniref:glycosyltransferase family 4 protein n=1 Tax=Epilithonimonas caeni TaxID=365343 RepID=UPI00146E8EA5|nr:glycosyltransferase family 1 protein [Epilithonimonas caeni]